MTVTLLLAGKPVFKLGEFGVHGGLLFEEEGITMRQEKQEDLFCMTSFNFERK
jgi:hypothetical protein